MKRKKNNKYNYFKNRIKIYGETNFKKEKITHTQKKYNI